MTSTHFSKTLKIVNKKGLHARASAKFATCAGGFDAKIEVRRDGICVPGTSVLGLMMFAANKGSTIDVSAEGPEAEAALDALETLVSNGFDETD